VRSGTVDGVDAGVAGAAKFGGEFLTGNITLYAKANTLFASTGRFARLTASQRQVLRSAARRTFTFALATPPEPGGLAAFCASGPGGTASPTAVGASNPAAQPQYAEPQPRPPRKR